MPYLTTRENLKLQLSPGLVASYDIQPKNGVGLLWDTQHTHIFIYLLTYFPRTHTGSPQQGNDICSGQTHSLGFKYTKMRQQTHFGI